MRTYLHPISRALVALIFIMSGFGKLMAFGMTAQVMGGVGFPAPQFFLVCAIVIELFGGLALLVGYQTRLAAAALIVFLIPATIIFHAAHLGGPDGQMQMIEVLKNLAIMGALLKFLADGAGAFSIDNKSAAQAV
ncbi:MAG: DoxX family protein [Pyrinomonadaceae bacterium]